MTYSAPMPQLNPLVRLQVQDSLRINAERWSLAHDYHRHRQSVLHQALWEPGIISGLGVKVIAPPENTSQQFRDQRWLEIQPGLAIDVQGNPIVVPASAGATRLLDSEENLDRSHRTYRIAVKAPTSGALKVYVVLSYVDPDALEPLDADDRVVEGYRFDQLLQPPGPKDIELCRLHLEPGPVHLKMPEDPLKPKAGQVDLRHRRYARQRLQGWLRVGSLSGLSNQFRANLGDLSRSLPTLLPTLGVTLLPDAVLTQEASPWHTCNLLYSDGFQLLNWLEQMSTHEKDRLERYLGAGGTLLVEANRPGMNLSHLLQQLEAFNAYPQPLTGSDDILRQPFMFGQGITLADQAVPLFYDGGIVVVAGRLTEAWSGGSLSRNDIRSAQELGINILNFAWERHYLHQLLQ